MPSDYHHGDLPSALRASAVDLIAERGPAGFSLREVARRAGVSHAAPAHHFGDAQGLLNSVAAEGFTTLTKAMRGAIDPDATPRERLIACGSAYVETALANPGHYAVMITHEYTDANEPHLQQCGSEAYEALLDTVEFLRDSLNPDLDVDSTATLLWAGAHGLVEISGVLGDVAEAVHRNSATVAQLIESWADLLIGGIQAR